MMNGEKYEPTSLEVKFKFMLQKRLLGLETKILFCTGLKLMFA
jgi:hypothetical protein